MKNEVNIPYYLTDHNLFRSCSNTKWHNAPSDFLLVKNVDYEAFFILQMFIFKLFLDCQEVCVIWETINSGFFFILCYAYICYLLCAYLTNIFYLPSLWCTLCSNYVINYVPLYNLYNLYMLVFNTYLLLSYSITDGLVSVANKEIWRPLSQFGKRGFLFIHCNSGNIYDHK